MEQAVLMLKLQDNLFHETYHVYSFASDISTLKLFNEVCKEKGTTVSRLFASALYRYLKQDKEPQHYNRGFGGTYIINSRPGRPAINALKIRADNLGMKHSEISNNIVGGVILDDLIFQDLKIVTRCMTENDLDSYFLGS